MVVFLLCLLAGFAVYGPALGGSFVWDDFYLFAKTLLPRPVF